MLERATGATAASTPNTTIAATDPTTTNTYALAPVVDLNIAVYLEQAS